MICHVFLNMHFQMETLQILTIVVTEIIAILSRTRYTKKEKYIGFFGKGQYMCKKKEAESTLDSLVFMNTPITSADEDVIGFSTYVEKLDAAITAGGQMIALTSPFGAGKTSIVENTEKTNISALSRYLCGLTSFQQGATGRQTGKKARRRTCIVVIRPNFTKDLFTSLLAKSTGEKVIM